MGAAAADAAALHHVVEDRLEQVDRHDHVALERAGVDLLLDQERADAGKLAVGADQRRAAPLRMRGRGEDRLVEHVFPVAGELALGEHRRLERMRAAAVPGDHHVLADADRAALPRSIGLDAQLAERLHQAKRSSGRRA